tara:strand:- start:122 stop:2113 length:1992 start_codon:yes stop_codon:yes gene_type:complete
MAENNIKIYTIKVDTKTGKIAVDNLTKGFVKSETALRSLNTTLQTTTKKGVSPLADSTGLAGAAVNELGRTVSDAGYGIRGMANNISQLGSLFAILVARTGSLSNALKVMGKQFVGPLGILFFFQAAVAALEYFSRETKTAEDAVSDLDNAFGKQASQLKTYVSILQESNVPLDERKELVTELNKEHKDLNVQLDEEGRLTEESTKLTNEYIKTLEIKAKAQAIITRLQENYNEELERETEEIGQNLSFMDKLATVFTIRKGYNADLINEEKSVRKKTEADREANEENEKLIGMLNELGIIPEINEKKEKKAAKSRKEFVAKRLSFADDILKSEENVTKQTIHGKEQQLRAESQYQMDLAQFKFDEYKRKEEDRVAAIKDPEDRAKAEKKADEAIKESQNSLSLFKLQKMQETNDLIDIERINDLQKARLRQANFMEKEREAVLAFDVTMAENEMNKIANERLLNEEIHNNKIQNIRDEIAERILANKSYVDLIEKETNEVNKQERFKTKIKRKEEKTKLAIANQVAQAMISIAGEGSAVGKAVAVAMAIINTKEAVTAALGAKPYGPWNIAQAIATGAFGLKQVQEIMSTKLPVAGAKSGGGGASMSVSAPSFNVVGVGGTSQIAEAVTGAQDRPFRAYVVSTDVTSAQELDRKTSAESAIG